MFVLERFAIGLVRSKEYAGYGAVNGVRPNCSRIVLRKKKHAIDVIIKTHEVLGQNKIVHKLVNPKKTIDRAFGLSLQLRVNKASDTTRRLDPRRVDATVNSA